MLKPPRRFDGPERLDTPGDWSPEELGEALRQVRMVNRWLGGTAVALDFLGTRPELRPGTRASLLDVATGSGDIPFALLGWARARRIELSVTATDISPDVLLTARRHAGARRGVRVELADALALPYADGSFDYVTCNMALHHFPPSAAVQVLREMYRVARRALLVNDLLRSRPAYWGARTIFMATSNPLTRYDGPLSVLRSFTPAEMEALAAEAGLPQVSVRVRPVFRLELIASCSE